MVRKSSVAPVSNEFFYCVCAGSLVSKDSHLNPLICKTCAKKSHRECARYSRTDDDFECMLCKVHLLDPFHTVEDLLWYNCIGNSSLYFVIDASNLRKWRSNSKEIYMACVPLNKDRLQHEWPKTFQLKINNDIIHVVKEPSWEHKRRDNPIKITYAMRTGENLFNITSTTYNEHEPLFLLVMFICKQVSVDTIVDTVKRNQAMPYEDARERVHSILNTKIGDDDIVCMESTHKMDLNCPVTLDKITIPTRGRHCRHLQCYDLIGYLKVMERTSAFNMRWKCPECHLIVKPFDLVIDTYVDKLITELPDAKSIELDKDLNYRIISDSNIAKGGRDHSRDEASDKDDDELAASVPEPTKPKSNDVIELEESDDQNLEVICISDDDIKVVDPNPKRRRLRKDSGKPRATASKSKPAKTADIIPPTTQPSLFDEPPVILEPEPPVEGRRRRRKLKKPPDNHDFSVFSVSDSTLQDCVNTFNQRTIDAFSKSTPSLDRFALRPPLIEDN